MKCQKCGNSIANVFYTQVVNGKRMEFALCSDCASELNIGNFAFAKSFSNFFEDDFFFPHFNGFTNNFFGGLENAFVSNQRVSLLDDFFDRSNDADDTLKDFADRRKLREKDDSKKNLNGVQKLKAELEKCIKDENYEQAAVIRDKIKNLEKKDN